MFFPSNGWFDLVCCFLYLSLHHSPSMRIPVAAHDSTPRPHISSQDLNREFVFVPLPLVQNLQGLTGTHLVAGSPIRHDNGVQGNPVEVQTYQPPWKTLSDFALQSDLDQPAFQQLVGHIQLFI